GQTAALLPGTAEEADRDAGEGRCDGRVTGHGTILPLARPAPVPYEEVVLDAASVKALRELLASTGWGERTRRFGRSLREAGHDPGGLLLVGTPDEEPWHLTAHLDEESRWSGMPALAPTLIRWQPPPGAPAHLAIGLDRLEQAGK